VILFIYSNYNIYNIRELKMLKNNLPENPKIFAKRTFFGYTTLLSPWLGSHAEIMAIILSLKKGAHESEV
jgi:hypothetical protein